MSTDAPRFALYYAPAPDDPLAQAGADWLGRDAETGAPRPQPYPGMAEITADPCGYGFHATLKPPMRLAPGCGWDEVAEGAAAFAAGLAPFDLPPLAVTDLGGFLALCARTASPALRACADGAVAALDPLRAPPAPAELERRRKANLSAAQDALLRRWGYPYVFDEWTFHMTLTRRLAAAERETWQARAEAHFAAALAVPRRVTELCVFSQRGAGAPFLVAARFPLLGRP